MSGVLCLDLAKTVGWAHATDEAIAAWPAGDLHARGHVWTGLRSSSAEFKGYGPDHGYHYDDLRTWLGDILSLTNPTWVCFEAPLLPRKETTVFSAGKQFARAGIVEMVCAARKRSHCYPDLTYTTSVSTARRHFTGSGHSKKFEVISACRARGWAPKNGDEADALCLLDYEAAEYRNKVLGRRRAA